MALAVLSRPPTRARVLHARVQRLARWLSIDNGDNAAILSPVIQTRFVRFWAKSGIFRAGVSAVLMLWCLLSLTIGATQALCLEVGGECSPSAAVPTGPCHEQAPDSGLTPVCGSCIDVLVPEDSSASCSRPDRNLQAFAVAQSLLAANAALITKEDSSAAATAFQGGNAPLQPFPRATVLRI